jgi:hypothetical protein
VASRRRWWFLFAVAAGACGGTTAAPTRDAGVDGTVALDAAPDATQDMDGGDNVDVGAADGGDVVNPSPCPRTPPSVGSSCSRELLSCEYGASDDPLCNKAYQCNGGKWSLAYDGFGCRFTGTNDPACPATYGDVPQNGPCSGPPLCDYPQGRCECILSCGHPLPDAGSHWVCSSAGVGCPSPRGDNKLGAACSLPGLVCQYGICCATTSQTCGDAGIWEGFISYSLCP